MQVHLACCWFSFACSSFLTLVYWRLGYRFRLLTFMSLMLALQHSQKLYLMTVRVLLPAAYYRPTLLSSGVVLLNAFAVAAYNLALIAICVHLFLLIQAVGSGYDHIRAQLHYIVGISGVSALQLLHVAVYNARGLGRIEQLPFLWIQHVILVLQVAVCPPLVAHLLVKCYRARERTSELLQKSSISTSLMWRLLVALLALALFTTRTLYIQVAAGLRAGSAGAFRPFRMWEATAEQLAYRYQVGNVIGPVLMLIFLTAQEPSEHVREQACRAAAWLCGGRGPRRASLAQLEAGGPAVLDRHFPLRESFDTHLDPACGSSGTELSLGPAEAHRLESYDAGRAGQLRSASVAAGGEAHGRASRSASVSTPAGAARLVRSDSLREVVVLAGDWEAQ